ncbi:MAG TPA: sulfur transferase domain-containing protein, partial [Thermoanaerobaculia bacterium]|nr:sulfur transferase domain-containing protein [Thermoanaerobaculia bacterium]
MRNITGAAVMLLATACMSIPEGPLANGGVRNFVEVNPALSRGAQPTAAGVATLAARDIVTIVDLRPRDADPAAFDRERNAAAALGLQFKSYPLSNWFAPPVSRVEEILAAINDRDLQPVFVHCHRG